MAKIHYDKDADLALIRARRSPSSATARRATRTRSTCSDSGVDVRVGLPTARKSRGQGRGRRARPSSSVAEAAALGRRHHDAGARHRRSPRSTSEHIAPHLTAGKTLMFAHGFNIRFGTIAPPTDVDVAHDRAQGARPPRARDVRGRRRHAGAVAVHQDATRPGARRWRWRTRKAHRRAPAPASSRPPSPRRPRPTCSASRPCCAAA